MERKLHAVFNSRLNPASPGRFLLQESPPVTLEDLDNRFHATSLRGFHINENGFCDRFREEIELWVEKLELGEIIWPERSFCFTRNFRDVVDYIASKKLWVFDIWNYIPLKEGPETEKPHRSWNPADAQAGDAHNYLLQKLGPRFLGWDNGEQDGRYYASYALRNCPGSQTRFDAYRRFVRYFHRLSDAQHNFLNLLCGLYTPHIMAHMGNHRLLGAETAQMLPSVPPWYAFIRGAGKQYGLFWFGNASIFNRWGVKSYGKNPTQYRGPESGTSLSLLKRIWYAEFMYGSCFMGIENGHLYEGELTPIGKLHRQLYKWCSNRFNPDAAQYTPVAFIMDFYSGWQPPRNVYGLNYQYLVWNEMDYTAGDHQVDQLFRTVWPGYQDCSYYRNERGFLTETPAGDIFDVLTSNVRQNVLGQYSCAVCAGEMRVEGRLWNKLKLFVQKGGHAVFALNQADTEVLGELGIRLSGELSGNESVDAKGRRFREKTFRFAEADFQGAESMLKSAEGRPLVFRISFGKGFFTVITVPYGLSEPDKNFSIDVDRSLDYRWSHDYSGPVCMEETPLPSPYSMLEGIKSVLLDLFDEYNIVSIEGPPIQFITVLGEKTDEITLTLINNSNETWSGSFRLRHGDIAEMEDIYNGIILTPDEKREIPAGELAIYRITSARKFMKFKKQEENNPLPAVISARSSFLPARDIHHNIDLLRRTDIRGVEIDASQVIKMDEDSLLTLFEQIEEAELRVTAINMAVCQTPYTGQHFGSSIPEGRRRAHELSDKAVNLAKRLHPKYIIVSPGYMGRRNESNWRRGINDVSNLARQLHPMGIDVLIEMGPATLIERVCPESSPPPADIATRFIREAEQPNIFVAVNTGHAICLRQDPIEVIRANFSLLRHVQLSSVSVSSGGAVLDRHIPPDIDAEKTGAILDCLAEGKFRGTVTLDCFWQDEDIKGLKETLNRLRTRHGFLEDRV